MSKAGIYFSSHASAEGEVALEGCGFVVTKNISTKDGIDSTIVVVLCCAQPPAHNRWSGTVAQQYS